ncbi:hypothetical protein G9A89_015622 [Geosiphon pyriformis]|nr:hypothetical protein G9A89_015622 [Geosiphon pyriformis]
MTQQSWRLAIVVHQLISSSLQQPSGLCQQNSNTGQPQNPNSQNYLSLLINPKDASANNPEFAQKQPLTNNIPSATITENKSLAAIFLFKFEETTAIPLFSGATLEAKLITVMYIDTKVKEQSIKLILDNGIITTDGATKTPISEIDDFPFEVNDIAPSKEQPLIELEEEEKKPIWEAYQVFWADVDHNKLPLILS